LGDHPDSEQGLIASSYQLEPRREITTQKLNATTFSGMSLATLESTYSAILVPSDHDGTLTEVDLAALDAAQLRAAWIRANGLWPAVVLTRTFE
jgi:hypothetical protein